MLYIITVKSFIDQRHSAELAGCGQTCLKLIASGVDQGQIHSLRDIKKHVGHCGTDGMLNDQTCGT